MKSEQIIIEPVRGWQVINWRELRDYRDLFRFLVDRDIKVLYKQTVLGFGWAILRPVLSMVIFTIIFGNLAQVDSDGVPYAIFSYVALVPWLYFSTALSASALSLVNNTEMLTKIYFPRLTFPMTPVFSKLVDFAISFVIVFVLMAWFRIMPTARVLYLPLLILLMMLTAAGMGLVCGHVGAIPRREARHAVPDADIDVCRAGRVGGFAHHRTVWSGGTDSLRPLPDGGRHRGFPLGAARYRADALGHDRRGHSFGAGYFHHRAVLFPAHGSHFRGCGLNRR